MFSSSNAGSQELVSPTIPEVSSLLGSDSEGAVWWEAEYWEESSTYSCLLTLKRSYVLGQELLWMARARQGPIRLLSTELVRLFLRVALCISG